MKKFKELMRRPITIGDCVCAIFVLGQILVALGMIGKLKIDEMRRKKTKNGKKGYTTVKPVGSDGWYNPEYYNKAREVIK